jgi:proteasome lid subunit RPN8/RPN11
MARAVRRAIVAHARRAAPLECCGFLLGSHGHVAHAAPMRNAADGAVRYRIADRDHLTLRRAVRGLVPPIGIVGVYHSHPRGRAVPSGTDVSDAHYPDWVHVIVGLRPRLEVRAFRIRRGAVRPVRVRLVSSPV